MSATLPAPATTSGTGSASSAEDSKSMSGSRRSSQLGSHQLRSPISCIVVGTSTSRTIVASSAIATASPMPISLTCGTPVPAKIANTATMISAALEIVRALADRPWATACWVSPVAW